jgi:hypothetical protein
VANVVALPDPMPLEFVAMGVDKKVKGIIKNAYGPASYDEAL